MKPITLPIKAQYNIINEVESKYLKFLDPNFDSSCFLKCRDNFALNSHIESKKIFEASKINNPTFSIAIPTYNRLESLKEAIYSALNQDTNIEYEIIVVENVDDFKSKSLAEEMLQKEFSKEGRITYYKNKENLGMFGNWNRCLELARGEWVCILHSDDRIMPNYIEEMSKVVGNKENAKYSLIGCLEQKANPYIINGSLREKFAHFLTKSKNLITRKNQIKIFDECNLQGPAVQLPPSAILHNKQKCIKLGGYNQDEYPLGDTSFHTRAYHFSKVAIYLKPLQYKTTDLSEGLTPKTTMYYCYISPAFFYSTHQHLKPKFYIKMLCYKRIKNLQENLTDYPILYNHVKNLIKPYNLAIPLDCISKFFTLYYLLKDFFKPQK